jgi:hypothetical protein
MSSGNISKTMLLALISCCLILVIAVPALAHKPRPVLSPAQRSGEAYQGEAGATAISSLKEIQTQYDHYLKQARQYEASMLALKIAISLFGLSSAIVLALSKADWSRKTALVLSILVASIPAADHIFQVSEMRQVSWRTAVDLSRLYSQCKDTWEEYAYSTPLEERLLAAQELSKNCKGALAKSVDNELEVSLKPLEVNVPKKSGV